MSLVPKYFPYTRPRLTQIEVFGALRRWSEKKIYIEAPTGTGKTAAILSFLLENPKILWFTFTKREQDIVVREAKRIKEKWGLDFKVVVIRGVSSRCPILEVRESPFPYQACLLTRSKGRQECLDCPYRRQFREALYAKLVVTSYAYLSKGLFDRIRDVFSACQVVVLDEAHHLILPPRVEIPLSLAEKAYAEGGESIRELREMVERKPVVRVGVVSVELTSSIYVNEVVSRLKRCRVFYYDSIEEKYVGLEKDFHGFLKSILEEKDVVVTSATLTKLRRVLGSGDEYRVQFHEYKFYPIIYAGGEFPKKKWFSYRVLEELEWIIESACRFYTRVLAVFPSKELLEQYSEHCYLPENCLTVVAGSKEAEGIDVDAEICLILSVPYDRVTKVHRELFKYLRRYTRRPRVMGYIIPAVIKAVQAAGRILRKPFRVLVFYDGRWKYLRKYFPVWLKNSKIKVI
ncbi:MAG: hypothetical protein DRJ52_10525, partial [Thermoprotei archaeon]